MFRIINVIVLIGLATSPVSVWAQSEKAARDAFAELDREVEQYKADRDAEYAEYVKFVLGGLGLDLLEAGIDTAATYRLMGIGDRFAQGMKDNPLRKKEIRAFADDVREQFITPPTSPALLEITENIVIKIEEARERCGWYDRKDPENWKSRVGDIWTSPNGKITYAVGKASSRRLSLAANAAAARARMLLAARTTDGLLMGSTPIRQHQDIKGGIYTQYVLMAIPTELLN